MGLWFLSPLRLGVVQTKRMEPEALDEPIIIHDQHRFCDAAHASPHSVTDALGLNDVLMF